MRTVKNAEERKNEILDAAEVLFAKKGFEETSTGDILEMVGIARGTLYYHFRSKEEILDSDIEALIAERQAARKEKNFKRADEIRDELLAKGIVLEDTREGVKWKRA